MENMDLKKLSELSFNERAFLNIYLEHPASVESLEKKLNKLEVIFSTNEKQERDYFIENKKSVLEYLSKNPFESKSLCIFACSALDYLEVFHLSVPVEDQIVIDSSPFIRPLAEIQDEYENVAVIIADNKKTRVYLVSSLVNSSESVIKGNIKNHVKKGGWSQQRYERRRDKEILGYSREIVEALFSLYKKERFNRILLAGGKEILMKIYENLPKALKPLAIIKHMDVNKSQKKINEDIMEMFSQKEKESEIELWEQIKTEYMQNGLGIIGIKDVLDAVKVGRVEKVIVNRSFKPEGSRCRDCENVFISNQKCPACQSESFFKVDLVNEIVELLKLSNGEIDFADPIPELVQLGEIAAFLRYQF